MPRSRGSKGNIPQHTTLARQQRQHSTTFHTRAAAHLHSTTFNTRGSAATFHNIPRQCSSTPTFHNMPHSCGSGGSIPQHSTLVRRRWLQSTTCHAREAARQHSTTLHTCTAAAATVPQRCTLEWQRHNIPHHSTPSQQRRQPSTTFHTCAAAHQHSTTCHIQAAPHQHPTTLYIPRPCSSAPTFHDISHSCSSGGNIPQHSTPAQQRNIPQHCTLARQRRQHSTTFHTRAAAAAAFHNIPHSRSSAPTFHIQSTFAWHWWQHSTPFHICAAAHKHPTTFHTRAAANQHSTTFHTCAQVATIRMFVRLRNSTPLSCVAAFLGMSPLQIQTLANSVQPRGLPTAFWTSRRDMDARLKC